MLITKYRIGPHTSVITGRVENVHDNLKDIMA